MMFTLAICGGYFIPSLNPGKKDMRPGMIRKRINISVAPIHGPGSAWMKKKKSYSPRRALLHMIFMAAKEQGITYSLILSWRSMHQQANESGIFKQCTMMYGTATFPQPRH